MSNVLIKTSDWGPVEDRLCKVASLDVNGDGAQRATITLDSPSLPVDTIGVIFHKLDFQHLQAAFTLRGDGNDRVVAIEWSRRHLKGIRKPFSPFLPRMTVAVFTTRAFELLINPDCEPELRGEARFLAEQPIAVWYPS